MQGFKEILNKVHSGRNYQELEQELLLTSRGVISENVEIIEIPEFSSNLKFTVERQPETEVIEFIVENCDDLSVVYDFLMSKNLKEHTSGSKGILLIKFITIKYSGALSDEKMKELNRKFAKKSVVIFLASSDDEHFMIYWKSNQIQEFLTLLPYKDAFCKDDKLLCEYVVEFLKKSLKKGHLGLHRKFSIDVSGTKIELHHLADRDNFNLLFIASKAGNINIVEILLKYRMSVEMQDSSINAQALAWQAGHYDIVLLLVKANFTYPQPLNYLLCSMELQQFIDMTEDLHEAVQNNNVEEVLKTIGENKNQRYFYSIRNESVLNIALLNEDLKMYDLLIDNGCAFGPHEDVAKLCVTFSKEKKEQLLQIHIKYSIQPSENHINILMCNSSLNHDVSESKDRFDRILRAYKFLNANESTKILLQAVAMSKKIQIIYDFDRDSVSQIDPHIPSNVPGAFDTSGRIVIAAKQLLDPSTEEETYAVMAHEFCHFAVYLTYSNNAKPYKEDDEERMKEFEKICEACEKKSASEDIIASVFRDYDKKFHHAELIVRAPHLIILYGSYHEALAETERVFYKLFNIYRSKIIPDMKNSLKEIENKLVEAKDKKIQEQEKIIVENERVILEKDREIKEKIVENIKQRKAIYILIAMSIVVAFLVGIIFYTPTYAFWEMSDSKKNDVRNAYVNFKNTTVRLRDLFSDSSEAYSKLTSEQITNLLNGRGLAIDYTRLDEYIYFSWGNLTDRLKEKFLNSNFTFQKQNLKFSDIQHINPKQFSALKSEEICKVFEEKLLEVGTILKNRSEFYVERKFIPVNSLTVATEYLKTNIATSFDEYYLHFPKENLVLKSGKSYEQNKNDLKNYRRLDENEKIMKVTMNAVKLHKDIDNILDTIGTDQTMILSSEAGTGKTVVFEQLTLRVKEKFPTHWVSLIDSDKHKRVYAHDEKLKDVEKVLEDILELERQSEFEREIFKESFNSGNCVFIWNDFEEIQSSYAKFMMKIISYIHAHTNNWQFISTTPSSSAKLSKKLNVQPDMLVPFNNAEIESYVVKFFGSKHLSSPKLENDIEKAKKFLNLSIESPHQRSFDTPLLLNLISETISKQGDKNDSTTSINVYKIYSDFMSIKHYIKLSEIYHHFALRSHILDVDFFAFPFLRKLEIIKNLQHFKREITYEEVSQNGILKVKDDNDFEFEHRSYAEFFVAQYFIENIYKTFSNEYNDLKLRLTLFFYMIQNYDNYERIFMFIESFIDNDTQFQNQFNQGITSVLKKDFKPKLLSILLPRNEEESDEKVKLRQPAFEFFLKFFKKDQAFLQDLLKINDNESFCTAIENPYYRVKSEAKQQLTEIMNCEKQNPIAVLSNFVDDPSDFENNFWGFYGNNSIFKDERFFLSPAISYVLQKCVSLDNGYDTFKSEALKIVSKDKMPDFVGNLFSWYFGSETRYEENLDKLIYLTQELLTDESQIKIMILSSDFLFLAARQCDKFGIMWNFTKNYTTENERRDLLMYNSSTKPIPNYYTDFDFRDTIYTTMFHRIFFDYELSDFRSCIQFGREIYADHFNRSEIREMIIESNYGLIELVKSESFELVSEIFNYFAELFNSKENDEELNDDRKKLKRIFEEKIYGTNLNISQYLKELDDLFEDYDLAENIKTLQKFYDKLKIKL